MRIKNMLWGTALALGLGACEKMEDTYSEYLKDGVIVYTARVDSLRAYPGKNRIELEWLLVADPKITKCRVFWNNNGDSVEVPVQRTSGIDTVGVILNNLPENIYSFHVYTYDNAGHSSVKEEVIGAVYGDIYGSSVSNRPVKSAKYQSAQKRAEVTWFGVNSQAVAVDIEYTDLSGAVVKSREVPVINPANPLKPPAFRDTIYLANYKQGQSFRFRTAYKPVPQAIDTFYTPYETQLVP
ncbi:DUF4998 domain-containing protein [Chitinophaga lutea]